MSEQLYLKSYLLPFEPWLSSPNVTDILVNRPGEMWIESADGGGLRCLETPGLTEQILQRLARQIAGLSHQGVSREHPLVSASLPDGSRVQIVSPPATRRGIALSIRRHALTDLSIEKLAQGGMFPRIGPNYASNEGSAELEALRLAGKTREFLVRAVELRKALVLSGGTSSGKTTLLNALIKCIDRGERLVVIEDAPEVVLDHPNSLGLIAVRGETGQARIEVEDLLQATLRLRPDRILLGELRGKEAFAFLRAINTGHPGSITTIHADSAKGALDQIAMLGLLGGLQMDWRALRSYAEQVIDYVVQLRRDAHGRSVVQVALASEL